MNAGNRAGNTMTLTIIQRARLPAHERVLDRLGDLLFDAEEAIEMLGGQDAVGIRWMEPKLRKVFEDVNEMMKRLSD